MDENFAPSYDFKLAYRRERSMTEPLLEENEFNEKGMPAAFYRSSSEDENTNDSGVSFAFDGDQPTSFEDFDATPKAFKTPRKPLGDLTKQYENVEFSEESPVSRKPSFQRKRVISSVHRTPSESNLKRSKANESCMVIPRTMSSMELGRSPLNEPVSYSLDVVENPQKVAEAYKSISGECLYKLINSMNEDDFSEKYVIIDCRYPFEYNGGHVKGAINVHDTTDLEMFFYDGKKKPLHSRIPIFYCEYSQKRGPRMALQLRKLDRNVNSDVYPHLDFNEIYLLDRGYKKLYDVDQIYSICDPQSYISMDHPAHASDLRRYSNHTKGGKTRAISRHPSLREAGERRNIGRHQSLREARESKRGIDSLASPMHHLNLQMSSPSPAVRQLNFNNVTPKTSRS